MRNPHATTPEEAKLHIPKQIPPKEHDSDPKNGANNPPNKQKHDSSKPASQQTTHQTPQNNSHIHETSKQKHYQPHTNTETLTTTKEPVNQHPKKPNDQRPKMTNKGTRTVTLWIRSERNCPNPHSQEVHQSSSGEPYQTPESELYCERDRRPE